MEASAPAVSITGLRKVFGERTPAPVLALDGVDLTVARGEVFGLLGRNGAGKTTTMKILINMISRYEGECRILGGQPGSEESRRRTGFLPEATEFHSWLTAEETLTLHGELHGVPKPTLRERVPELLAQVGLEEKSWRRRVGPFSKGMLQRLGLAVTLVGDPDLLLLDEPAANLDPIGRRDVRDLLLALERAGKTVFLNSHILSDVELTCHRVAILERGRVIASGDVMDLARMRPYAHIRATSIPEALLADLRQLSDDVAVIDDTIVVRVRTEEDMDPIPAMVERHGAKLRYLALARESLEDVFLRTVGAGEEREEAARA
jgi:ABC-2 type transport system ATP-binding protein